METQVCLYFNVMNNDSTVSVGLLAVLWIDLICRWFTDLI